MYGDRAMAKKMGRPPIEDRDKKTEPLKVKVSPADLELYQAAHKESYPRQSFTWWVKFILDGEVERMKRGGWRPPEKPQLRVVAARDEKKD